MITRHRHEVVAVLLMSLATCLMVPSTTASGFSPTGPSPLRHQQIPNHLGSVFRGRVPVTVTASADASPKITSWDSWSNEDGTLKIVGDVFNGTDSRIQNIVQAGLYDVSDKLIDTWEQHPFADPIAAGNHSPFALLGTTSSTVDHIVLFPVTVPWEYGPVVGGLRILANPPSDEVDGRHYTGWLKNESTSTLGTWTVSLGLYSPAGIVNSAVAPTGSGTLIPGASVPFEIVLPDHYAATRLLYQAKGGYPWWPHLVAASWENSFDDIASSTFHGDIIWLAMAGITKGCGKPGRFCPDDSVTRGQMAAFLHRALSLAPSATDYFSDDNGTIFEADINALAASGITKGCTATTFCPDLTVTRGQMAAFLHRALHLAPSSADYFSDDDGTLFEADINALAAAGITKGCTATTFCPDLTVTRGQMAAFLHRALG